MKNKTRNLAACHASLSSPDFLSAYILTMSSRAVSAPVVSVKYLHLLHKDNKCESFSRKKCVRSVCNT